MKKIEAVFGTDKATFNGVEWLSLSPMLASMLNLSMENRAITGGYDPIPPWGNATAVVTYLQGRVIVDTGSGPAIEARERAIQEGRKV